MKAVVKAYKDLLGVLINEIPKTVILVLLAAVTGGLLSFLTVWVNSRIFNLGLDVVSGDIQFVSYIPYLILFAVITIVPPLLQDLFNYTYAEPKCQLVLRTIYKGRMLQKLKDMKYEYLESEVGMEVIDKAYNRVENAARHLFPMYLSYAISSVVGAIGILWLFAATRWWLLLTILVPFAIETFLSSKINTNIYDEMEGYWKRERAYGTLGNMLRSREYIKENRLFGLSDYLIKTYSQRLSSRNKEYEHFYFKSLKRKFTTGNIVKLAQVGNALILLWLCMNGDLDIGMAISLTIVLFTTLLASDGSLEGCTHLFRWGGFHVKTFVFYDKYFELENEKRGTFSKIPDEFSIEFKDVWFKYPGTEKDILRGLTFNIKSGEKVSIVGENGEGKTTMVKLLLGLFEPDSGEIRIGGRSLSEYSREALQMMFGAVFQDFIRYNLTLEENVAAGDIGKLNDEHAVSSAMKKAKVDIIADELTEGKKTLLGRDFKGGVDISGGQWQRVAIARAFMGEKPVLILDEPTSQLDPMAESQLYREFSEMSLGKTALFITHRLGSTAITDRILVISNGCVIQTGSREELLATGGLYADMWNAQKQWYEEKGGDLSE